MKATMTLTVKSALSALLWSILFIGALANGIGGKPTQCSIGEAAGSCYKLHKSRVPLRKPAGLFAQLSGGAIQT